MILEAENLSKHYKDKIALHNLNLQIPAGEVFCLLGQNGAGKTTTINLFLGFTKASGGKAKIKGIEVKPDSTETKKYLAYLPETVLLYPNLSGLENLAFFSRLAGYKYSQDQLANFLTKSGLPSEAFKKRVGTYSKGMRQKVGIGIAIAKNAEVLLLDEPTSGLDPKASNEFSDLLHQLSQNGRAILMATHDIFRAREVGTRVGIMREGNLVSVLQTNEINANELEKLYLQTV
jgi:ABC-2 type transport system ATP-binding protein